MGQERSEDAVSLEQEDGQRIRFALSTLPMAVWEWELATDRIVSSVR